MDTLRVNGRTFRFWDEDCFQQVRGLPDQFSGLDLPRHVLHVESGGGFDIRVRVDHELKDWQKMVTGVRGWKARLYDWCPFLPYSWRPEVEYSRDIPIMFGPMFVLGAGFASHRCIVRPDTVLRIRPRIALFPNGMFNTVAVERLMQWLLSDGFRPKPYYDYDYGSGRTILCTGALISSEFAMDHQSPPPR